MSETPRRYHDRDPDLKDLLKPLLPPEARVSFSALWHGGFRTVEQVDAATDLELQQPRGIGPEAVAHLRRAVAQLTGRAWGEVRSEQEIRAELARLDAALAEATTDKARTVLTFGAEMLRWVLQEPSTIVEVSEEPV